MSALTGTTCMYIRLAMLKKVIRIFFRRGEEFEVTPTSSELLFYPPSRVVTVSGKC